MSRPKTVKSKSKSKSVASESKPSVEAKSAGKPATPESTPDQNVESEHRAETHQKPPAEENPWSEWLWSEEGQMCYRGRRDSKGEWEYDFAPLPKEKERPYTPPKEEPIEYLIEELKMIWEPRLIEVPDGYLVTVTSGSSGPSKGAVDKDGSPEKVKVDVKEEKSEEDKNQKASEGDDKESKTFSSKKSEKSEKVKKEKPVERRGRQLERKHLSHKEKKEKVERWRKGLE